MGLKTNLEGQVHIYSRVSTVGFHMVFSKICSGRCFSPYLLFNPALPSPAPFNPPFHFSHFLLHSTCVLCPLHWNPIHGPSLASCFLWALQFKHTYLKESMLASTYEKEHVAFVFLGPVASLRMVLIPYFFQSFTVLCKVAGNCFLHLLNLKNRNEKKNFIEHSSMLGLRTLQCTHK